MLLCVLEIEYKMDRIQIICSYLKPCYTFADVACDHGYCAEYMLKNDLCRKAVISDVSAKSLEKAEKLLSGYIKNGRCRSVCCDGLEKIDGADEVLIAGIGGEEIVKILKNSYIPETFIFQPMKNAEALRAYLLENGCKIQTDDVFTDGKNYYFIISGKSAGCDGNYTKAQLLYGRDSLKNSVFREFLKAELDKKQSYLSRPMTDENRAGLENTIEFMQGVLNGEIE